MKIFYKHIQSIILWWWVPLFASSRCWYRFSSSYVFCNWLQEFKKPVYLEKKKDYWFRRRRKKQKTQNNTSMEIKTFSGVFRSVDHWAAASICYKDVIHSNYCVSEFSTKVSFQNKLWKQDSDTCSCLKSRSLVHGLRSLHNFSTFKN